MHNCPSCNRSIPDARYCPYCAAEQIPQPQYYYNHFPFHNGQQDQRNYQPANASYGGFAPASSVPSAQQHVPRHKRNTIVVDENDFIIYDAAPRKGEQLNATETYEAATEADLFSHEQPTQSIPQQTYPAAASEPEHHLEPSIETGPETLPATNEIPNIAHAAAEQYPRLIIDTTQALAAIPALNSYAGPESAAVSDTSKQKTDQVVLPNPELELNIQSCVTIPSSYF